MICEHGYQICHCHELQRAQPQIQMLCVSATTPSIPLMTLTLCLAVNSPHFICLFQGLKALSFHENYYCSDTKILIL